MNGSKKYKVLAVDDNEAGRIILQRNIERAMPHVEVIEAISGDEALSIIEKHTIDLVLLDIQMPGMDGYETAEKIKKLSSGRHIPIIFITAFDPGEQHREKALQSGGVDYLTKPVSSIELVRLLTLYFRFIERERIMNNELVELNEQLSTEIRERKGIEQQLRTSNAKYKAVYTRANDAILLIDNERIVECNDTTFEIFGYLRDDIVGQPIHVLNPPIQRGNINSKEAMTSYITEARRGNSKRFNWKNQRKDGSSFDSEVSLLSYFINGRKYIQVTIRKLSIDDPAMSFYRSKSTEMIITEAGNIAGGEGILPEYEAALLITKMLHVPACCTDMTGVFEYVNPAFERAAGVKKSGLTSKTFFNFVSGDDLPKLESAYEKAAGGKECVTVNFQFLNGRHSYDTYRAQLQVVLGARAKTMIIVLYESNENLELQHSSRKNLAFFEDVINALPQPLILKDSEHKIILVNQALCNTLGRNREDLLGRGDETVFGGNAVDGLHTHEEQLIESGGVYELELAVKNADGHEETFLTREKVLRDIDGAEYILAVFNDISLRKSAESKFKEQFDINKGLTSLAKALLVPGELSLRQIAEKALAEARNFTESEEGFIYVLVPDADSESDSFIAETRLISKALRLKRMQPDNRQAGNPLQQTIDQFSSLAERDQSPFYSNTPQSENPPGISEKVTEKIHNCIYVPAMLGDRPVGQFVLFNSERNYREEDVSVLGNIADIFALAYRTKQTEIMLRSGEARHRALLEALPSSVFKVHKEGIILDAEDKRTGQHTVAEGGIPLESYFPIKAVEKIMEIASDSQKSKSTNKIEYERFEEDSNLLRYEEAVIVPAGEDVFIIVVNDVTERILAARELDRARDDAEAASRLKSNFLAQISHELRTPLNGILGYTQLLKKETSLGTHVRQSLDIIENSGVHLLSLINEILDLSYFESDEAEPEEMVFSILTLLRGVVVITQERAERKKLDFHYRISGKIPGYVKGDEKRLTKALLILLGNALRYTSQGEVKLTVSGYDGVLNFSVQDTGKGIPQTELKNIFSPFHQVLHGKFGEMEGPGLGLSVFKKLIELMDGQYGVESEPGKGSMFWFKIPLIKAEPPDDDDEMDLPMISGYKGEQKTVLIIEDAPYNRDLLISMLAGVGLKIEEAVDGLDGIEKAKEIVPDLIFLDLNMPVLDGFKTIELLRTSKKVQHLPIIAISSDTSKKMIERCKDAGFNSLVGKPFNMHEIYKKTAEELSLQWVYDGLERESKAKRETAADPAESHKVLLPPEPLIKKLLEAAQLGDITEIRASIKTIENAHSDYRHFIGYIKRFLENYQIEEMVELLRSYNQQD